MARGSANNVAANRTRSKRGTPTKEIDEKQTNSIDKKLVTRRKNVTASKVKDKVTKKCDEFEDDNSGETSSKNEELNFSNESFGKKEVLNKNQQNKASKAVGKKRNIESTVSELTEETVSEVENDIVEKRPVRGHNKKLKTDTMDEISQYSIKAAKSDLTKNAVEENVIGECSDEDKDLETSINEEVMEKVSNIEVKDLCTTLDDNSQGSVKSGTTRKTRSTKKVDDNISSELNTTKTVKAKDNNIENKVKTDTVDDTSQDAVKLIKSGPSRLTRRVKKSDECISVEQKETIDALAYKNMSSNVSSVEVDIVDESSRDSLKISKSISTRKTRSTTRVEEIVTEPSNEDKASQLKDTGNLLIDGLVVKDKTDIIDDNDKVPISKISTRKTRNTKKVEDSITVEFEDIKAEEMKEKIICIENDDTSQESVNINEGGTTRKTRNAKKAEVNINDELKVEERKTNTKADGHDDSSLDSIKSNQSGPTTRRTKNVKKVIVQKNTADMEVKGEKGYVTIHASDNNSSGDSMNTNQSGPLRKTRNAKKVEEITNVKQDDAIENEGKDEKNLELCITDIDCQDPLKKQNMKSITTKDKISKESIENNQTISLSEVSEQITDIEERLEQDQKQMESDSANDITQGFIKLVKDPNRETTNAKDFQETIADHKNEDLEEKNCIVKEIGKKLDFHENESKSGKLEDDAKDFDHIDSKNSKLKAKINQYENDAKIKVDAGDFEVENANVGKVKINNFEIKDASENFDKSLEDCEKSRKKDSDSESSEINKDILLCRIEETESLKKEGNVPNYNKKVIKPKIFDEDEQSKCETLDQLSNIVMIADKRDIQSTASFESDKNKDQATFEDTSAQFPENIVDNLDCMPGKIDHSEDAQKSKNTDSYSEEVLSSNIDCGEATSRRQIITVKESALDVTSPESKINDQAIVIQSNFENGFNSFKELDTSSDKSINQDQSNLRMEGEYDRDKAPFKEMCSVGSIEQHKDKTEEKYAENIKPIEVIAGNVKDNKFSEEIELKDSMICQRGIERISIKNPRTDISENIDNEDSTTSIIGEPSEKANNDIDMCSDKTEEASIVNFETESSTTDSDAANLVIADSIEHINTEIEISELLTGNKRAVNDNSNSGNRNQEDTSSKITDKEKSEMNFTGCKELSTENVLESSIINIAGNEKDFEVNAMKDADVALAKVEMHTTTHLAPKDGTENSPSNEENDLTKLNTINTSIRDNETNKDQITNSSVINNETLVVKPKMVLDFKSEVSEITKSNIQMPPTVTNAASTSKDSNEAEDSSSSDKIVIDSDHGKNNLEEKQEASRKKKTNESSMNEGNSDKTSLDLKEAEKNKVKRLTTTYEVSSNVDCKKGVKRNLVNEGESCSGTEVSLSLKIKRKRVEGVESYDVSPSSLSEQATPNVSNETKVKELTQKLFADYQSEPGPSGTQQESRRSSRKRKKEESDQQSRENSAAPIRMYLEKFVPFLLEGLLKITYVRPDDPIQYLADWMKENKEAAYSSMNNGGNGNISSDERD